ATLVHPYADPRVIAGQGTATLELLAAAPGLDVVVVPVGGGGLAAGAALALAGRSPGTALVLAEPAGAADALHALRRGRREPVPAPGTICDGLRATLGEPNFRILHASGAQVLAVEDADAIAAMRLLLERLRLLVEPSSAVALAAVLAHRERFAGRRVGIVLTAGSARCCAGCCGCACSRCCGWRGWRPGSTGWASATRRGRPTRSSCSAPPPTTRCPRRCSGRGSNTGWTSTAPDMRGCCCSPAA